MNLSKLRITEIFFSIQGESTLVGLPTVFVRLTGCPLRCHYCDTAYAFTGGVWMSFDDILSEIKKYTIKRVTITGGEPLAQKNCIYLMHKLCEEGYVVSLETSGALDISEVDARVIKVMDLKTPSSGEEERNIYKNLDYLISDDQLKFVISDRPDYDWSKYILNKYNLLSKCNILLSPSYGVCAAATLADWILEDRLPIRFQIQLHKVLWGDRRGR